MNIFERAPSKSLIKGSVIIVACCYRMEPDDFAARLDKLAKAVPFLHGYVFSSKVLRERSIGKRWSILPVNNSDFDFSAYMEGVSVVKDRHSSDNSIIFLNDTLFTNHSATANFQALRRHIDLMQQIEVPAMAGKMDSYRSICLKSPWNGLDRYVSTYCFMLNHCAVGHLLELQRFAEIDGVTHHQEVDSSVWGRGLPLAFRQFVKANLVYNDSPYLWYRLRKSSYSSSQLSSKARTIYFEHRLSGIIGEVGCLVATNAGPRWNAYMSLSELMARFTRKLGF